MGAPGGIILVDLWRQLRGNCVVGGPQGLILVANFLATFLYGKGHVIIIFVCFNTVFLSIKGNPHWGGGSPERGEVGKGVFFRAHPRMSSGCCADSIAVISQGNLFA